MSHVSPTTNIVLIQSATHRGRLPADYQMVPNEVNRKSLEIVNSAGHRTGQNFYLSNSFESSNKNEKELTRNELIKYELH